MNNGLKIILIVLAVIMLVSIALIFVNNKKGKDNITNQNSTKNEDVNEKTNTNIKDRREDMQNNKIKLTINGEVLTATLVENSSTKVLLERLSDGDITINMHDYSNFEKVGELGFNLPRNDESIDTDYGDLILYQGKSFVIYYDTNSWNFTRLGRIDNITQDELKRILGSGNVVVTISLY